jgi:hypothetical protein
MAGLRRLRAEERTHYFGKTAVVFCFQDAVRKHTGVQIFKKHEVVIPLINRIYYGLWQVCDLVTEPAIAEFVSEYRYFSVVCKIVI